MLTAFISYSHEDEKHRERLEKQLKVLQRSNILSTWNDRRISVGAELDKEIRQHVEEDDLIILLVSPDFIASDYCYDKEMQRALERHDADDAVVVPVILRPCDWKNTRLSSLLAAPRDGLAITKWPDQDEAFLDVAQAIRVAANRLLERRRSKEASARTADEWGTVEESGVANLTARQARTLLDGCSPKIQRALRFIVRQGLRGFEIADLADELGVDLETSDLRGVWAGITKRTRTVTGDSEIYLIHWVGHDSGWRGQLSPTSHKALESALRT